METIYFIINNLDSELIFQVTYVSHFWQIKIFDKDLLYGMMLIDL